MRGRRGGCRSRRLTEEADVPGGAFLPECVNAPAGDARRGMSAHKDLEHKCLKATCRAASEALLDVAQSTLNQLFAWLDKDPTLNKL